MRLPKKSLAFAALATSVAMAPSAPAFAEVGFGKPGEKVSVVVGYQPYYTESWSGVVINGKQLWKKYLPKGSSAKFEIGPLGRYFFQSCLADLSETQGS